MEIGYLQFEAILEKSKELPISIFELDKASKMNGIVSLIRYYDEVLTESARNYAYTADKKWEERYLDTEPKLESSIQKTLILGDEKDKNYFENIHDANKKLIVMEYRAINLVNTGNQTEAIEILESLGYLEQKKNYEIGLREFISEKGVNYDSVLSISTDQANILASTTHQSILSSRDSIIFLYLITISSSFLVGFFIIRSILKPINHLGNIERKISNGDFNTKIEKISNDELGSLTESFDKMIQEIKKSRVNLEKTTALNSLEEISARLAHDMRDPLNIIKGVYQLLSLKLYEKLDEKEKINFQRMGKGIDRLEFQIDDVLNFARTKALRLETISVNKLIQESVYLSIIPKNIILNIEKSKLNLICDKEKMIAVIANLIKNAVESIGTDGKIEIKIEENKDHLIIKFIDSGKGIDEDKLDLIFAPLFTTKFSGTGLGLSTCKNILTQHNGSISVKNNPTTFTVTLPKNLKP